MINNFRSKGICLENTVLYSDMPSSGISPDIKSWPSNFSLHHKEVTQQEINSLGFRSDEFTDSHNDKHILFLGCSYTWGTGLYLDEVWSKILYKEIKKSYNLSGYFSLGIPGDSIFSSIVNAFKYFKNFGNPDIIFFNVQDIERFYYLDKKDQKIFRANFKENLLINLLAYQYYYMLEQYCIANKIKLVSFTWYLGHKDHALKSFNSFYETDIDDISEYVANYYNETSDELSLLARDGKHLGKAYHQYWADFIYDKFMIEAI